MANKKRKSGNRKPKSSPQRKPAGQGGQRPQQGAQQGSTETAPSKASSDQKSPGQKSTGQKNPGQRSGSGSSRRAAQRRAAKRKRQMLTVGLPIAIVVLLVVLVIALNGGPQGSGKVASASDVKVSGPPRTTLVPEGEKMPTFSAPGLKGGTVTSAQGQPSVVAIWASWCHVCQEEIPILNTVKDGYPGVKVAALVTSQGQEPGPTPEAFVADNNITIPVGVDDANGDLRKAHGVTSFPTLYFVNADGTVYKNNIGLLDEAALNEYFTTLQAQADSAAPTPTPKPAN